MAEAEAKKSSFPASKIILFGILAVAIVALLFDRQARSSAESFRDKVVAGIPKIGVDGDGGDESGWNLAKVHEVAGREPSTSYDHETANRTFVEEYSWRGAFRQYTVYCYYRVAADKILDAVSLNEPLQETQL